MQVVRVLTSFTFMGRRGSGILGPDQLHCLQKNSPPLTKLSFIHYLLFFVVFNTDQVGFVSKLFKIATPTAWPFFLHFLASFSFEPFFISVMLCTYVRTYVCTYPYLLRYIVLDFSQRDFLKMIKKP